MEIPAGGLQAVCANPVATHTHTRCNIWFYGPSSDVEFSIFPSAASSWIQVNLGQTRKVTGIVIQGCPQYDYWVTKFKLQHSMDGLSWTDYTADGEVSEPHFNIIQKVTAILLLNHMVRLINGPGWREMSVRYQSICWPLIPDLRVKDLSHILDESNQRNLLKCAYVNFFFFIDYL